MFGVDCESFGVGCGCTSPHATENPLPPPPPLHPLPQGLFSVAKSMMSEIFSPTLPALVTAGFASAYVLALSAGNLGGRLLWAAVADKIGRRATFHVFTLARY
jgi:hypothetical protein